MLAGADCSWPSAEEIAKASQVRQNCLSEIRALSDPTRDVVGDIRLARFLRFNSGDVQKATKGYKEFLTWRVKENIETLRKGVIELDAVDFMKWVEDIRSPYGPPVCLELGVSPEGHSVIFASPGYFKAVDFVKERPACHTMDTDLLLVRICTEWIMKRIDDRSYKQHKMLYTIKVTDLKDLGKERIPIFVSEIRTFAKTNVPGLMSMYCEHDILIMIVNTPFIFRVLFAFASTLMSKRQVERVKPFSDVMAKEPQDLLKALLAPDDLPTNLGGRRENVQMAFPPAYEDPALVARFKAVQTPPLVRDQEPKCALLERPELQKGTLQPSVRMSVDDQGRATVIEEISNAESAAEMNKAQSAGSITAVTASNTQKDSTAALAASVDDFEKDVMQNEAPKSDPAPRLAAATATEAADGVITPSNGWSCCGAANA